ncbi:MAG TPA: CusA/CzcA family heavy metal efflux RND transporter [Gemmatimonadales bacterium]|nr:CusA/CzcA family heavy metal efflux RND transporter [Gemmatimonadales bacterium]
MGLVERFTAAALRQRLFVILCVAALVVTGVVAWRDVPVEAFPDLTNNQVVVVTDAPGLAAPEVEQRVTYPLETALMGTPGAEEVRSISKFGLSIVTVVFEDAVPVYFARQLVAERLADAQGRLPAGLDPVLGPVATAFGEIYQYLVESDGSDPMAAKTFHDWDMRNRLRSVRGVSEVNSWGGLTRQYHVIVDPRRLEKYRLSLRQVIDALAHNNVSFSGGFVEHRSERVTVRGTGLARGTDDLGLIVVTAVDGAPVYVRDVAEVRIGPMPRQGAVTRDGKGETIAGMVIMMKGENSRTVGARVKARVDEIAKTLPAGLTLTPFYDQTEVVDRTARTVRNNLIEGSLLVVAVLFFFLRDMRASLIVAAVIPFSMLAGFIGMRVFGVSANLMSLGAIDFGLIVDGAVVMMENFIRRRALREHEPGDHPPGEHRLRFFTDAATEVARPVLFGVLIIVAVYLPIFTLEGLEGKMFRPMAITVCSAILGSLLLSLTAVPVAAFYLLKLTGVHHEEGWFTRLRARYRTHLDDAMNHRQRTVGVALAVVAVALASVPFLGTEFMPRLDEGSILIETRKLPSIALEDSVEVSSRVERIVRQFPEVRQVVTKIGRPDLATEAMGIYQGDVYVLLHPMDGWTTGRDKEGLIQAMSEALAIMPGVTVNFTQPMAMRLDEVVSGVKADVAVKIFGPDNAELERLGELVRRKLEGVAGVADLQVEALSGASELQVDINREAAARYGLNVTDVQEVVETAIGGTLATEVLDGARRFGVMVRLPEEYRTDRTAIEALPLTAPGGEKVPLGRVAAVKQAAAAEAIAHENGERRLVVQANVRGRDVGSFVADAQAELASLDLPPGYYIDWGGQFENQQRATARLAIVVPLSLVIIFLLLFVTFQRVRQAGLVILNVPFALVGGIAALWLRGLTLNLSASVGFIALFGVAVLNGVVMIAAINRLREQGAALRAAVVDGAETRLRPVLMTALVAALGFVPMALSHGAGAEVQRPLATVVIGGIITSTLLTLIVLPTVYEMIEERSVPDED